MSKGKQAFPPSNRAIQPAIGVQRHHPRQTGEIMALGQHLRADQDIQLARAHLAVDLGPGVAPADGVAVDAGNARSETAGARRLRCAGCLAPAVSGRGCCSWGRRDGFVVVAVVTLVAAVVPVQHQPRRAMRVTTASRSPQASTGAQPRRLMNTRLVSPAARLSASACQAAALKPSSSNWRRISSNESAAGGGAGAAGQPGVAIAAGLHRRHAFQRGRG